MLTKVLRLQATACLIVIGATSARLEAGYPGRRGTAAAEELVGIAHESGFFTTHRHTPSSPTRQRSAPDH
jgi:hypothetical protein